MRFARLFFINMINFNSHLQKETNLNQTINRGFIYGDALFDTIIFNDNRLIFVESHYFRLLASMRQLRMEIPTYFTQEYWEDEIRKTIKANNLTKARVRTTIFRDGKGLYTPKSNTIQYIIQISDFDYQTQSTYTLGVYKDNYLNTTSISNIKTTNRIANILASIYAKENKYDNCILLNHNKQIAEAINANIFLVFNNTIKTPALSEGCINGIIRKKLVEILNKSKDYQLIEGEISPFELLQANEVFLTNSVIGIQPVTNYKKKTYDTEVSELLYEQLEQISY